MALDERRRLVRSQQNKVIAGVAGGLGAHFNVDPILVRIAFVLLALADGIGVIAYLVAWALIPKEGELRSPAEAAVEKVSRDPQSRNNTWIWVAILGIVGVLIMATMSRWDWDAGVVIWALVLIGAGAWLYRQDFDSRHAPEAGPPSPPPPAPTPPPSSTPIVRTDTTPAVVDPAPPSGPVAASKSEGVATEPAGGAGTDPVGGGTKEPAGGIHEPTVPVSEASGVSPTTTAPLTGVATGRAEVVRPVRPVVPRRPRSHLGRYTFALTLLVLGIAALLENAGTVVLSAGQYGGLVLLTIGAGLLVGTFWGRSRFLILAGLLLLPLFLAADALGSWFDVPLDGGAGDRVYAPGSAGEIRDRYELTAGALNFNLTEMSWTSQPVEVEASVGFGEVNVLVPEGVNVDVTGRATVGSVSLFGEERAGFGVSFDAADDASSGEPQLVLDLSAFTGQVEVARAAGQARGL